VEGLSVNLLIFCFALLREYVFKPQNSLIERNCGNLSVDPRHIKEKKKINLKYILYLSVLVIKIRSNHCFIEVHCIGFFHCYNDIIIFI
jgi:hypothetical protein